MAFNLYDDNSAVRLDAEVVRPTTFERAPPLRCCPLREQGLGTKLAVFVHTLYAFPPLTGILHFTFDVFLTPFVKHPRGAKEAEGLPVGEVVTPVLSEGMILTVLCAPAPVDVCCHTASHALQGVHRVGAAIAPGFGDKIGGAWCYEALRGRRLNPAWREGAMVQQLTDIHQAGEEVGLEFHLHRLRHPSPHPQCILLP